MDQFVQSPVAGAWYNNVWTENPDEEDQDEMEDQLKHASDDSSSQYSENHVVVLKVGIHCEECKRIVTDALWGMPGVDQVDVDKEKQKVTVTGKVNAQRVLRRVQRTGKLVELWKSDSARALDSCDGCQASCLGWGKKRMAQKGQTRETPQWTPQAVGSRAASRSLQQSHKERKKGYTSPFVFPPNEYDQNLFTLNFPLIRQVEIGNGNVGNVVDNFGTDHLLDDDRVANLKLHWAKGVSDAYHFSMQHAKSEIACAGFHHAIFNMRCFSQISNAEMVWLNRFVRASKRQNVVVPNFSIKRARVGEEVEEQCGCSMKQIEVGENIIPYKEEILAHFGLLSFEAPPSTDGLQDGFNALWGTSVREANGIKKLGFADVCLETCDRDGLVRIARAILQLKSKDCAVGFGQAGWYAVMKCAEKIENGQAGNIYVLLMDRKYWTYGIMVLDGWAECDDGTITNMENYKGSKSRTELETELEKATPNLRKNFQENPNATYSGRQYIGTFYTHPGQVKLNLPNPGILSGFRDIGVDMLFKGLLRTILGNTKSLSSTKDDFQCLLDQRTLFKDSALKVIFDV